MEAAGIGRGTPSAPTRSAAPVVAAVTPTIADPGPLGLAAFALTTFVLSMFNADLIGKGGEPVVLAVALAYGGLGQLLAGMWEFKRGNTFAAVAFTSYGAFWLSFWALGALYAKSIPAADAGDAVGLYLIAWGIFTAYMWVASFRTSAGVMAVFLLLAITFFLLGFGNTGPHPNLVKWGGYFGLATAAAAWYVSFAQVMFSTFGRWILPIKPLADVPPRG